jgi:hypothetical protein
VVDPQGGSVSNLPERLGESRGVEILREARWPLVVATCSALSYGALSFFGGFGGAVIDPPGDAAGDPGGGAPPAGAPNAPTVDAVVFAPTGDSLRVLGGAYTGSGGDAHDSTAIQVDTAGGDFSSPQYWNVVLGPVETDTVTALDSASVVDIRMRYKGEAGDWSAWDTLAGVEMSLSSLYPNRPAGLTAIYINLGDIDTLVTGNGPGGLYPWENNGWLGSYDTVSTSAVGIPANPTGSATTLRMTHFNGSGGGNAQLLFFDTLKSYGGNDYGGQDYDGGPVETLYTSAWFYTTQCNFQHGMKYPGYWGMQFSGASGSGSNQFYMTSSGGCSNWNFTTQNQSAPSGSTNDYWNWPMSSSANQWHHLETCFRAETSNGSQDGQLLAIWDGDTIFAADTIGWSNINKTGRLFDGFLWNHHQTTTDTTHVYYEGGLALFGVPPGSNVDCIS